MTIQARLLRNYFSQLLFNSLVLFSSHSLWVVLMVSSTRLTTSKTWLMRSWTNLICGSRKLKSQTSPSIFSHIFTMTSNSTSTRLFSMITILSLKNFSFSNRLRQKCKQNWFCLHISSRSSRRTLIISSRNVSRDSSMSLLSDYIAGFKILVKLSLATKVA